MKLNYKSLVLIAVLLVVSIPVFALEGVVVSSTGKVEVQTATGWAPLKIGDEIQSGRVISTGFRSQAIIQVAGSSIVINQLSRLTLEQLTETNEAHESEVFIDLGSISADVQTSQNKRVGFVVNTPVATASVRGTAFDMGLAVIRVGRGQVDFKGARGGTVSVKAGGISKIGEKRVASNPHVTKVNEALGNNNADDDSLLTSVTDTSLQAATNTQGSATQTTSVVVGLDALDD